MDRSASVFTVVSAVEVLLAVLGSEVEEATSAWLEMTEPSGVEGSTVAVMVTVRESEAAVVAEEARGRCTVKASGGPAGRPVVLAQVTVPALSEHRGSEPVAWKVVPAGRASVTVNPPALSEGPLLVTVRV